MKILVITLCKVVNKNRNHWFLLLIVLSMLLKKRMKLQRVYARQEKKMIKFKILISLKVHFGENQFLQEKLKELYNLII